MSDPTTAVVRPKRPSRRTLTVAAMVVVVASVAGTLVFRSSRQWHRYVDPGSLGFSIDYPDGWEPQPMRLELEGLNAVVILAPGHELSKAISQRLLGFAVADPFYGINLFSGSGAPDPSGSIVEAARKAGCGDLHQPARRVSLGGLPAAEFEQTTGGRFGRVVCAFKGRTAVTFVARAPAPLDEHTRAIFDRAQRSVRF